MNNPKPRIIINFRVYRRTQEYIVLLCNKKNLTPEHLKHVELHLIEVGIERDLKFKIDTDIKDPNIKDDTVMLVISHTDNEIDPYSKCKIRLTLGNIEPLSQELVVFPFSVLPNKAKDNKNQYAFLFAWSEKDRAFVKLSGDYLKDGRFVLLTKQVKE